jgi:serine/threonine-protein kinase PpkA
VTENLVLQRHLKTPESGPRQGVEIEIPGYRLLRLIAQGGMASVYLAVQESLDRQVALKLLRKRDFRAETERFLNEGRIISSLNHRNIITIHDIGVVDERPYISMEFLKGGDLQHRIKAGIEPSAALDIVRAIARCLAFVHAHGIVHRDIKPGNILFHEDGTPILTDFGIAKELKTDNSLTLDGSALGSPDYLSPEQAQGRPLDGRADIYSLGVVLYEMLAGERPYRGDSPIEVMLAHLAEPVPQLSGVNRPYQDLLDRMMAKKAEQRFASAQALLACLEKTGTEGYPDTVALPAPGFFSRRRLEIPRGYPRRIWGSAAAGALVIALGLAIAAVTRSSTSVETTTTRLSEVTPTAAQALNSKAKPDSVKDVVTMPASSVAKTTPPVQDASVGSPAESQGSGSVKTAQTALHPAKMAESDRIPDDPRQQELDQFLNSASAALADYRLTVPQGNNAHFYLLRALELAPDNTQAKQGIADVANAYADLVEGALDKFAYSDAKRYLSRGLSVQPDNRRLLGLRESTEAHKDAPTRLVKKIKAWF